MLTACSAIALAGCGGDEQKVDRRVDTTPRIERAVADRLASRSDSLAGRLESGDWCGAVAEAGRLRAELTASISSIPDVYLEDLSGLVNEIQAEIPPCDQTSTEDEDDGEGKSKHKKKKKKKHKGDDGQEGED